MDWKTEYKRKLKSPDEAARLIQSKERVMVAGASTDQPKAMKTALFNRRNELNDVSIFHLCPGNEPGWLDPGHEAQFKVDITGYISSLGRPAVTEKRAGFIPNAWDMTLKDFERAGEHKPLDWHIIVVSPPNRHGFCSLGPFLWMKKEFAKRAKKIIAEVDENVRWVYGDTTIHVSEMDVFVEHTPEILSDKELPEALKHIESDEKRAKMEIYTQQMLPHLRPTVLGIFEMLDIADIDSIAETIGLVPPDEAQAIAGHLNTLLRSGDTIQIGQGSPSAYMYRFGAFEGKEDLGYHGEMTARGILTMIKEGQMTGKRKSFYPEKAIFSALDGVSPEELEYACENPKIELYPTNWVSTIPVISANDNMVSIQNGVSIDLTGQINAETILGGLPLNGPGGQPPSHIGALSSRGGRAITLMRSTAVNGSISCIITQFEPGDIVTVPRAYADYVVTEFGVARLMGKTLRERSEELIAIAHPDFREELKEQAKELFWP